MPTENQTSSPSPKNSRDRTERGMFLLGVVFWVGLVVLLVNVPEAGYSFLHTETAETVEALFGVTKVTPEAAALEYLPQILGAFVVLAIVGNTIALLSERRRRKEREQLPTARTAKN